MMDLELTHDGSLDRIPLMQPMAIATPPHTFSESGQCFFGVTYIATRALAYTTLFSTWCLLHILQFMISNFLKYHVQQ